MSGAEPLVSIVLPTYNRASWLDRAVQSCAGQRYQNWELIIVDDCSADETPEKIAGYADPRIRSIRNERNRKIPGSLNAGFALARGEYFTWTSDDNCFRREAIGEMVAALEADPGVGLVYANYTTIDSEDRPMEHVSSTHRIPAAGGPPREADRSPRCITQRNVVGFCFLYRRSVADAIGTYAEDLFLVEDFDYWLRLCSRYPIKLLDKDLYLAREHPNSLSATRRHDVTVAAVMALEKHLPQLSWLRSGELARSYGFAASEAAAVNDIEAACRLVRKGMRYSARGVLSTAPPGLVAKALLPRQVYEFGRRHFGRLLK